MHPNWICVICRATNNNPKCWQCGHVFGSSAADAGYENAKAVDSALDRASIPAMFNVVGDELRKMNDRLEFLQGFVKGFADSTGEAFGTVGEGIAHLMEKQVTASHARQAATERIESQLTALRAEADKGRDRLDGEFAVLNMRLLSIEKHVKPYAGKMRKRGRK